MYERMFYGLKIGCDCSNVGRYQNSFDTGVVCTTNQTRFGCQNSEALTPVRMNRIDGKLVCGKLSGVSFVQVVRPDLQGNCPENY